MPDIDLQQKALELVESLKLSGLSNADIAAYLVFGLGYIALDKNTSEEVMQILATLAK